MRIDAAAADPGCRAVCQPTSTTNQDSTQQQIDIGQWLVAEIVTGDGLTKQSGGLVNLRTGNALRRTGPAPTPTPPAWGRLLGDYLDHLAAAGYPATTAATRAAHVRRMARALGVSPENVTGDSLIRFFAEQSHWARETRRGYRNTGVSFFGWAHKEGRIRSNPATALPTVKPKTPSPRPAPDRVYRAALMAAGPREMLMLRLAAEAGLRRAEVAQVHTSDLTEGIDGYSLLVHGKGDKPRMIPLSDELGDLVALGAAGHTPGASPTGWLFPGEDGGHLSPRWVGKLCGAVMPDGWTMHKLRHRFATRAYRGSRNLRAVQTLMGHASVATTEAYTAVDDAEVRAAMVAASEPSRATRIARSIGAVAAACVLLAGLNSHDVAAAVTSLFTPAERAFVATLTSQPGFQYRGRSEATLVAYARGACRAQSEAWGIGDDEAVTYLAGRVYGGQRGAVRWWQYIGDTSLCVGSAVAA